MAQAYKPHAFQYVADQKPILGDTFSVNHYIGSEKAISMTGLWSAVRNTGKAKAVSQIARKQFFHFQHEYTVQSALTDMILKLGTQQDIKKTLRVSEQFITGGGSYNKDQQKVVDLKADKSAGGRVVTGQILSVEREKNMVLRELKINLAYCRLGVVFGGHCYIELQRRDLTWFRIDLADQKPAEMFFQEYLLWSKMNYSQLLDVTKHYPGYLDRYLTPADMVKTFAYAAMAGNKEFMEKEAPEMIAAQEKLWAQQRAKYIDKALNACENIAIVEEEKKLKSLKTKSSGQFNAMKQAKDYGTKMAYGIEAAQFSRDAAKIESKLYLKRTLAQACLDYSDENDKVIKV